MGVINATMWATGLSPAVTLKRRDTLEEQNVKTEAVFKDLQAAS